MEAALYDPDGGFFARAGGAGGAGRAGGDFLTSVEVGSLFGALVARAVDGWWDRLDRPDPFLVVDAGAGRGQLARDVLRAGPGCAGALRYVLVERSARLRAAQAEHLPLEPAELVLGPAVPPEPGEEPVTVPGSGPVVTALEELPAGPAVGVIVANELADNLPIRIVERTPGGWNEIRVSEADGRFAEIVMPADDGLAAVADRLAEGHDIPVGARLPIPSALFEWLRSAGAMLRRGFVAIIDYAAPVEVLAARGQSGWLRTYRAQRPGGSPLDAPGWQDITADVPVEGLGRAAAAAGLAVLTETTQAEWLRSLGVDELVEEARAAWHGREATDLAAIAARSRVHEADALLDPAGLGAHRVTILGKRV
ncbi:MAG TPA: class I SAM-dependent methyltransferase [Acidimicrobiia bacterium]|nr:class I SAM-dependent methyltransferase [Acidimicrobiia bacterium]HKN90018.1 class I SAM-dependent methyltransferase [Acidimicrobiia bacterium]HMC79094.1 class I SAM-dependent methyltransferase [Acidimicrobiia bacterium]